MLSVELYFGELLRFYYTSTSRIYVYSPCPCLLLNNILVELPVLYESVVDKLQDDRKKGTHPTHGASISYQADAEQQLVELVNELLNCKSKHVSLDRKVQAVQAENGAYTNAHAVCCSVSHFMTAH